MTFDVARNAAAPPGGPSRTAHGDALGTNGMPRRGRNAGHTQAELVRNAVASVGRYRGNVMLARAATSVTEKGRAEAGAGRRRDEMTLKSH